MRKALPLIAFVMLLLGAGLPQALQACESCADEGTCLPTWSGAKECTWVQKCRVFGTFPYETEVCWWICKQNDFTCTFRPDGGPPRV